MILQALHRLAQDEELIGDPDNERKPVAYLVRVGDGGELFEIGGTHTVPEAKPGSKRRPRPVAKTMKVPREPGRTSADRANFLIDKAEYVLGIDPAGNRPPEKLANRFALFRERVAECLEATGDEGVAAALAFLDRLDAGEIDVELREETSGNELFAFVYGDDVSPITQRPKVQEYWRAQRAALRPAVTNEARGICLVTGEQTAPATKHTLLKHVPGAVTSGVPLVSFNRKAFESYGLKNNENAVVSPEAAEVYATALQRLLHPTPPHPERPGEILERRHLRLGADTTVCYWTAGGAQTFASIFADLLRAGEVPEAYQSIWHGRLSGILEKDDEALAPFYALILSGAQGRVIVRGWLESTVRQVARHLARYFEDIDIVSNTPPPRKGALPPRLPLGLLLESLGVMGKRETIAPQHAERLVQAALRGTPFPVAILQRAIQRERAEVRRDGWMDLRRRDARAALIKAVLRRLPNRQLKEISSVLDPENTHPGYLLGRLMAVIERLQRLAQGDLNATVIDRYFSAASASPRTVFVRLLKNTRNHARKARDNPRTRGSAIYLEKLLDELVTGFEPDQNGFPAHLSLAEQGLFILGYHQQRHAFNSGRKKGDATSGSPSEPPGEATA